MDDLKLKTREFCVRLESIVRSFDPSVNSREKGKVWDKALSGDESDVLASCVETLEVLMEQEGRPTAPSRMAKRTKRTIKEEEEVLTLLMEEGLVQKANGGYQLTPDGANLVEFGQERLGPVI